MKSLKIAKMNIEGIVKASIIYYCIFVCVIIGLIAVSGGRSSMSGVEFSTVIFIFVCGLNSFKSNFYFAKSNGISRKTFIKGLLISIIPIALFQEIFMLIIGMILGLTINGYIFLAALFLFPMSFLFIGFGILFGTLVNSKAVGGLSSIIPTMTSLLGGMFFPLDNMEGGFKTICYIFPFANATKVSNLIIQGNFNVWLPYLIVLAYVIVIYGISIFILNYKLSHDGI